MNQNNNSVTNSVKNCPDTAFGTFENAHGPVPYGMTNDYMFRAVLQTHNKVLCGLICSLLHLSKEEVASVEITNPITLGKSIERKELRLDIAVLLNNRTIINLEMQVANRKNWTNRSILYLCRSFDNPVHGQNYKEIKPAIHIGFLDYTLFDEYPEFYATYKLINVKNHHVYSDNFILSVVDLSKIELATEEDKAYRIDYWAALFKAKTWEELKMIAATDKDMEEAARALFLFCTDEQVRKACQDRDEYYQDMASYEREIAEKDEAIAKKDAIIEKLLAEIKALKN